VMKFPFSVLMNYDRLLYGVLLIFLVHTYDTWYGLICTGFCSCNN
jgi:hypothetical protein